MLIPMTKRVSIGPFFFFGLGGGGGGGGGGACWGGGAAWAVWVEPPPELEAQPTRPANTIVETRTLMPDIFFIIYTNGFSFFCPPMKAVVGLSVANHKENVKSL